jgi:hypothetical protein
VRRAVAAICVLVGLLGGTVLLAGSALAATAPPAYSVSFTGSGVEHHVDTQRNIQDSGICDSAEHVDVTARFSWSAAWRNVRPAKRAALLEPSGITGSRATGTDVKDGCDLPLDQAPSGWASQSACDVALVSGNAPRRIPTQGATAVVLGVSAPAFSLPPAAGCALNVRNDQLVAHMAVPAKKLGALKIGGSLSLQVGTSRPGAADHYAPSLDCSQPTKPYLGYRTTDQCHDDLSWSGVIKITRVS